MDFLDNPRLDYSAITARPDFTWPGGKRLAVYFALCVEHFSYGSGLGLPYSPGLDHPATYNWAWREWGNRVGGFRFADLFDDLALPLAVLLNTRCYDHCPELVDVFRRRGDEFVAHGRTNSENQNGMSLEDERALVAEVTAAMEEAEGRAPMGWMSPGANPSANTEDILAEQGYAYTLDWPVDDQPVWLKTRSRPLLSVPYPQEVNDVPMVVLHHGTSEAFATMVADNVLEMRDQAMAGRSLVAGITIHTFIAGQPFRLRRLREAIGRIMEHRDDIWFTTPGAIAAHHREVAGIAPPAAGALA